MKWYSSAFFVLTIQAMELPTDQALKKIKNEFAHIKMNDLYLNIKDFDDSPIYDLHMKNGLFPIGKTEFYLEYFTVQTLRYLLFGEKFEKRVGVDVTVEKIDSSEVLMNADGSMERSILKINKFIKIALVCDPHCEKHNYSNSHVLAMKYTQTFMITKELQEKQVHAVLLWEKLLKNQLLKMLYEMV